MGRRITLQKKAAIFKAYREMRKATPQMKRKDIIDRLQREYGLKWDTIDRVVTTGEELYRISSDG